MKYIIYDKGTLGESPWVLYTYVVRILLLELTHYPRYGFKMLCFRQVCSTRVIND